MKYYLNDVNKSRGSYILVGIWCLMVVVLTNFYAGILLSFLSVSKLDQPINSLEELANSKSCQLLVQASSDVANDFLVSHIFLNCMATCIKRSNCMQ